MTPDQQERAREQWHYDRDTQTLYHAAAAMGWHIEDRDADLLPPVLNDYETRLTNAAQALSAAREALQRIVSDDDDACESGRCWMADCEFCDKHSPWKIAQAALAELDKATEVGG